MKRESEAEDVTDNTSRTGALLLTFICKSFATSIPATFECIILSAIETKENRIEERDSLHNITLSAARLLAELKFPAVAGLGGCIHIRFSVLRNVAYALIPKIPGSSLKRLRKHVQMHLDALYTLLVLRNACRTPS